MALATTQPALPTAPARLALAVAGSTTLSAACFVALVHTPARAQDRDAAPRQKTESPYFFVRAMTRRRPAPSSPPRWMCA